MARVVVFLLISMGLLGFQACEPDYPVQPNATVLGEGLDCGWLLKFNEKRAELPESEDNTYIVVNHLFDFLVYFKDFKHSFSSTKTTIPTFFTARTTHK